MPYFRKPATGFARDTIPETRKAFMPRRFVKPVPYAQPLGSMMVRLLARLNLPALMRCPSSRRCMQCQWRSWASVGRDTRSCCVRTASFWTTAHCGALAPIGSLRRCQLHVPSRLFAIWNFTAIRPWLNLRLI